MVVREDVKNDWIVIKDETRPWSTIFFWRVMDDVNIFSESIFLLFFYILGRDVEIFRLFLLSFIFIDGAEWL